MRRPRITIAGLLGIVAFVAVAFAALREATNPWDSGVFGVILMTLLTSVLLAIHREADRRAYWIGFALFGWAYLSMSLIPSVEARLPTTRMLAIQWENLPRREVLWEDDLTLTNVRSFDVKSIAPATPAAPNPATGWDIVVYNATGSSPNTYIKRLVALPGDSAGNFVRIGHSLLAPIFALVGGWLSRRLYASSHRDHRNDRLDSASDDSAMMTRTGTRP
jgi:hypothetical protein